jgi:hypothetical protein
MPDKYASQNLYPGILIRESANDGSDFTDPPADYRVMFLGEDGLFHLRDAAGAVTSLGGNAAGTTYDPATSKLVGTNVQAAIDEMVAIMKAKGLIPSIAFSWHSDADLTSPEGLTLNCTHLYRDATDGPTGQATFVTENPATAGATNHTFLSLSGLPAGKCRITAKTISRSGGGSIIKVTVQGGTTTINDPTNPAWTIYVRDIIIGADGLLTLKHDYAVSVVDIDIEVARP